MTDEFKKANIENYTVAYDSKNVAVFVIKEPFTLSEGFENYTVQQYADLVIENNGLDCDSPKFENGLTYFNYEFTSLEDNECYTYFSYVYLF